MVLFLQEFLRFVPGHVYMCQTLHGMVVSNLVWEALWLWILRILVALGLLLRQCGITSWIVTSSYMYFFQMRIEQKPYSLFQTKCFCIFDVSSMTPRMRFKKNPLPTLPFFHAFCFSWIFLEGYHGFWVDVPLDLYWHHWAGTSREAETISKPSSLDNSTGSRRDSE